MSEQKKLYEFTRGNHGVFRPGVGPFVYEKGDEEWFLPSVVAASPVLKRSVALLDPQPDPVASAPTSEPDLAEKSILDLSWSRAKAEIGKLDDLDVVMSLFADEAAGKNRKSVKAALEARVAALTPAEKTESFAFGTVVKSAEDSD